MVNRIIVSSEDQEILDISKELGAEVPFKRPDKLAEDHILDWPVFEHALNFLNDNENYIPDYVVHLRPTAPYRRSQWIDEAIQKLIEEPTADSIRSVSEPEKHPYRMFDISADGFLDPIMKHRHSEPYLLRRQDLPLIYYYNCVIDVAKTETIIQKKSMTGDKILPYYMNSKEVMDIDSLADLEYARRFFETLK